MDYAIRNGQLMHADRKHHKYLYKKKLPNGKTRYFYSLREWHNFLKGKPESGFSVAKKAMKKVMTKVLNSLSIAIKRGKGRLSKVLPKTHKQEIAEMKREIVRNRLYRRIERRRKDARMREADLWRDQFEFQRKMKAKAARGESTREWWW